MSISNKLQRMLGLEFKIVDVRVRMEPQLFHETNMLVFLLKLLLFLQLILIFAEVHDLADRRQSVWDYFDQISPFLLSDRYRLPWSHHSKLGTIIVDHADLFRAYLVVYTGSFTFDAGISYTVIDFFATSS
jgi:hypothetical protein